MIRVLSGLAGLTLAFAAACSARQAASEHDHAMPGMSTASGGEMAGKQNLSLPASSAAAAQRLATSPRHGEWVMIKTGPTDSVRAWVSYPSRSDKAPVVVVLHEIFGLSTWVRGVADQVASDGYIAIAPDLLTGKAPLLGDSLPYSVARAEISKLKEDDVQRMITAVAKYGMNLPSAQKVYGTVGYCWGGQRSFAHAVENPPGLKASVVYYGQTPPVTDLPRIRVPVLGLYGSLDARQTLNVPPTDSAMKALGKSYDGHVYSGATHGFLRAQGDLATDGTTPASAAPNVAATADAWPLTVAFFRKNLGK